MRALIVAALLLAAAPARAEDYGSLDFSRLTKPQTDIFWRRLKSLAVERAVLAHCGEASDFEARVKQGVRACVTAAALGQTEAAFRTEMNSALATLRTRRASCHATPAPNKGWLGVELGTAGQGGAEVTGTVAGSPAAGADLKAGDVVTAVNGAAVDGPKALSTKIRALAPGAEAKLDVKRDGAALAVSVKLGGKAFDADGSPALDLPSMLTPARADLDAVAQEVTEMCGKCKMTIWALFCR